MKKSDLKTGMIIETRGGKLALVMKDNVSGEDAIIFHENIWTDLDDFHENLISHGMKSVDIMKIYKPDLPTGFLSRDNAFGNKKLTLIWEREPEKIYFIDGIKYSESTLKGIIKKAQNL